MELEQPLSAEGDLASSEVSGRGVREALGAGRDGGESTELLTNSETPLPKGTLPSSLPLDW